MDLTTHTAADTAQDGLDPAQYPRTYRVGRRNQIAYGLLGGLAAALGLAGAWYFATGHETKSAQEAAVLTAVCLAFVALGAVLILYMLSSKVMLHVDAIEVGDFARTRKLRRDDIAGWRSMKSQYGTMIWLVPKRAGMKRVKITPMIQADRAFDAWLATLPNLDASDVEKSMAEIASNREIARTPEERLARLASARKIAQGLTVAAGAIAVWGYAFPEPYEAAVAALAACPLVAFALAAKSGRLYQVAGFRNDARANLAWALMAPAVVLMLRAVLDIELLEWMPALAAAGAIAVVATFAFLAVDRELRERRWGLLAMLLISACYAFGAVVEANALFDPSKPGIFQSTVVGKHKSSGKTTTYYLRLTPWGPRKSEDDVSVSRVFYEATPPGRQVCIALWPGALSMPWFVVGRCTQ